MNKIFSKPFENILQKNCLVFDELLFELCTLSFCQYYHYQKQNYCISYVQQTIIWGRVTNNLNWKQCICESSFGEPYIVHRISKTEIAAFLLNGLCLLFQVLWINIISYESICFKKLNKKYFERLLIKTIPVKWYAFKNFQIF